MILEKKRPLREPTTQDLPPDNAGKNNRREYLAEPTYNLFEDEDTEPVEEVTEKSITTHAREYIESRSKDRSAPAAAMIVESGASIQSQEQELYNLLDPIADLATNLEIQGFPNTFQELAKLPTIQVDSYADELANLTGKLIIGDDFKHAAFKAKEIRRAVKMKAELEARDNPPQDLAAK